MVKISLFNVGLVTMLFFVLAANVFQDVAIATQVWSEDVTSTIWSACTFSSQTRSPCFQSNTPALIATGTALNSLSFVLIVIAQLALFNQRFRNSFSLYFVIGSFLCCLLGLVFNSTGWYFIFNYQYQATANNTAFKYGYSFWLMTPSFGCDVVAGLIGAAILGCTCVTNKVAKDRRLAAAESKFAKISTTYIHSNQAFYPCDHHSPQDPQVLRL